MPQRVLFLAAAIGVVGSSTLAAQDTQTARGTPTSVTVRVVAHDAKVIGSGVGGARIMVRNAATGEVLFEGLQEGGTGDTRLIVEEPVVRGAGVYDTPGTAGVTVELSLEEPTVLEFVGQGPLGYAQAAQEAIKTMLVVPGQDILGDGVILELHGFIVELIEPQEVEAGAESATVTVQVRMMCGSPLESGGLWDADRLDVIAQLWLDGQLLRAAPLAYAGTPDTFTGELPLEGVAGGAMLVVIASDPQRVNFGRSETLALP